MMISVGNIGVVGAAARRKGGGWSPSQLGTALLEEWDAERASTLGLSGSNVDSWASRKGLVLAQSVSASKPQYAASGLNGRPAVFIDGNDDELTAAGIGSLPNGAAPSETWMLVNSTRPNADTAIGYFLAWGDGTASTWRGVRRAVSSGVSRATSGVGDGGGLLTVANAAVEFTGIHIVRQRVGASAHQIDVDGISGASEALVPSTGNTRARMGSGAGPSPSSLGQGFINYAAVTSPLSDEQASKMITFLKARGGIA